MTTIAEHVNIALVQGHLKQGAMKEMTELDDSREAVLNFLIQDSKKLYKELMLSRAEIRSLREVYVVQNALAGYRCLDCNNGQKRIGAIIH